MGSDIDDETLLRARIQEYMHELDPEFLGLDHHVSAQNVEVTRIAAGESNSQFLVKADGNDFVMRMGLRRGNRVEALKEFVLLQAAQPLQIAPRPYYFDATGTFFPSDITIMEWINGRHLSQHQLHSRRTLEELAGLIAALHTSDILRTALEPFCPSGVERPNYRAAARAELLAWAELSYSRLVRLRQKYGLKDDDLMRLLRRCLQRERRRLIDAESLDGTVMVPTHGDIHIGNLLRLQDRRLKVIDWETASIQDPAFEFISLFTWEYFHLSEEIFLVDCYQEKTGFQNLHERIGIYQAVYLLGVVLDTALRAYLFYAGALRNDPSVGRSIGFYKRDFFICLSNYLHWYTDEPYYKGAYLRRLGQITPADWQLLDPSELIDFDINSDEEDVAVQEGEPD